MAGISIDRIIYSNRVRSLLNLKSGYKPTFLSLQTMLMIFQIIRMIADHEKEEDEIMGQADDWIFFALGKNHGKP